MARIKFLDVLEETKSKPLYRDQNIKDGSSSKTTTNFMQAERPIADRIERMPRVSGSNEMSNRMRRSIEIESPERNIRRIQENVMEEDSSLAYDTGYAGRRIPAGRSTMAAPQTSSMNILGMDDNKYLWTGALFVLFGGVLFLSGFWLGKTITSRSKLEVDTVLTQNQKDFRREEINNTISVSNFPSTVQPSTATLDVPTPPKPVRVVEPAVVPQKAAPVSKKPVVSSKNYAIQISAHSTMESARVIEDKLRSAGYSAYTSESVIGDAIFFRVRIRGFNDKKQAQNILAEIKSKGFGTDGFVLSLE